MTFQIKEFDICKEFEDGGNARGVVLLLQGGKLCFLLFLAHSVSGSMIMDMVYFFTCNRRNVHMKSL